METAQSIGEKGENVACSYLEKKGYRILTRNYANTKGLRLGEIDIVAEKGHEIIFVEVKAAFLDGNGENRLPEWQVTKAKLKKMEKVVSLYLREKRLLDRDYSFDVVAVTFGREENPEIRHLDHVFYS